MTAQRRVKQLLLSSLLCLTSLDASALLTIKPKPMDGHQHDRRAGKVFNLNGFENSSVTLITPDLQTRELVIDSGKLKFKPTGKDNYHALVAKRQHKGVQETAIRYVYSFGKPTGHSPSELTALEKSDLEIIPDPLPREHWHYKAGHQAAFFVRFKGIPLASSLVRLSTNHATILEATADTQGRVLFNLPDDFLETKPGDRANKSGELLIHVKHTDDGADHATWLSADYQVDPSHWRDTQLGAMVATGGFIFGAFVTGLGFRSKNKLTPKKNNQGANN